MTDGNELELVRQRKDAGELELRHRRAEVLVVRRHRAVRHAVVRCDAAQFGALEATRQAFVLHRMTLLEERRGGVDDIGTLPDELRVILEVVYAHTVQDSSLSIRTRLRRT